MSEPPEEPEEPQDGEPGPDDESTGNDDADAALRGWIDPDDRLWRHPSEVATPSAGTAAAPLLIKPPNRHPWRNVVMVLVGALAVVAAVAWLVILLSPASDHPLTGATRDTAAAPVSTLPGAQNAVPAAAEATGHSIVELRAVTAHGTATLIGVAVAEGGMVATTADVLSGLRRLDLVGPGGHLEPASVVGTDSSSDIALIDVPENVPVAPFSDDVGVGGGTPDLTLTLVPSGNALGAALHVRLRHERRHRHPERPGRRHALHRLLVARRRRRQPAAQQRRRRCSGSSTSPRWATRPP